MRDMILVNNPNSFMKILVFIPSIYLFSILSAVEASKRTISSFVLVSEKLYICVSVNYQQCTERLVKRQACYNHSVSVISAFPKSDCKLLFLIYDAH